MKCRRVVDGIPVDPELPDGFWNTPSEKRPCDHLEWWGRPFVVTVANADQEEVVRYGTYCLNDAAQDRPSFWGKFGSLKEAIGCANLAHYPKLISSQPR
jgi:hypothetical protein